MCSMTDRRHNPLRSDPAVAERKLGFPAPAGLPPPSSLAPPFAGLLLTLFPRCQGAFCPFLKAFFQRRRQPAWGALPRAACPHRRGGGARAGRPARRRREAAGWGRAAKAGGEAKGDLRWWRAREQSTETVLEAVGSSCLRTCFLLYFCNCCKTYLCRWRLLV